MHKFPDSNKLFDVNDVCNKPAMLDADVLSRLNKHGMIASIEACAHRRYRDVVKEKGIRRRPDSEEVSTVFVGYDKPFVERGKIKEACDIDRINNYFRLNNIDKESVIWFTVNTVEDGEGLVEFEISNNSNQKSNKEHTLCRVRPQFFYVKNIEVHYWLNIKKINKNHIAKVQDLIEKELAALSKNLNSQSFIANIDIKAHAEPQSKLMSIKTRSFAVLKANDISFNSEFVNKAIDKMIAYTDSGEKGSVCLRMRVEGDKFPASEGVERLVSHLKEHHAVLPAIGTIGFDEATATYALNINTRSLPMFCKMYNKHVNSLYQLMQIHIERAIEADKSIEAHRWSFSEAMFTSENYDEWSEVLLKALFQTLTDTIPELCILDVEKLQPVEALEAP